MIVTIDGPAASGKGTVARGLAARLGYDYLDTGAMYRTVALFALRRGISCDDRAALAPLLSEIDIDMRADRVLLNGEDVTAEIREPDVSPAASRVAAIPEVRRFLVPQQRRLAAGRRIICEGRDQGTVVFPDAPVKFYLTARICVRAERRYRELLGRGVVTTHDSVVLEIIDRDRRDRERADGPLRQPPDAVVVDSSDRTLDEVLDEMEGIIRRCATARA